MKAQSHTWQKQGRVKSAISSNITTDSSGKEMNKRNATFHLAENKKKVL